MLCKVTHASSLQRFEHDNVVELHNGIMFGFYPGLYGYRKNRITEQQSAKFKVHRITPVGNVTKLALTLLKESWEVRLSRLYWACAR